VARNCLLLAFLAASAVRAALVPIDLRCEYRVNPLGIASPNPRVSWVFATSAKLRNQKQTAWQVLVASTPENLNAGRGDLWDSGKVSSDETAHIQYRGAPLRSGTVYWWKVRVWDERGRASDWSRPARWQMGLLNGGDWKARWIQSPEPVVPAHEGYRSRFESSPDRTKWVAIDLLKPEPVELVRLYPARAGYLFPIRFRVDVSDSPSFERFLTVADRSSEDFPNPGAKPVDLKFSPSRARYVRLLVTKLAEDSGRYGFALAELEVLGRPAPAPLPYSHGGAVPAASDSDEEGPWGIYNLNDTVTVSTPNKAGRPAPATLLRTGVRIEAPVDSAYAYVSALGLYELRINGRRAGNHQLAPEWTDYNRRVMYQTYDVAELLRQGENAVGIIAGEGWYAGRVSFMPGRRWYGDKLRVIVQIDVRLKDGSRKLIISDENWKTTTAGPIRSADIFDGEVYDARMEMPGWDQPGFNAAAWKPAQEFRGVKAELVSQPNEPVTVTRELKPKAISEPAPGVYVLDLGQNMVGWVRMKVRGKAGTRVALQHAEMLLPDGNIYIDNIRQNLNGGEQKDVYILRGAPEGEIFEPRFTYHGFRYVEVTGLPERPTPDMFTGRVLHSSARETGDLVTSSSFVNRLLDAVRWTERGNLTGLPTDCPQRSERAGWMADAQIISQSAMFNMNLAPFYTKWLQDVRDAQGEAGNFSPFAPSPFGPGGGAGASPGWADGGLIIPWNAYLNYADRRLLEQHFDAAVRYVEFVHKSNPDLIWRKNASRGAAFNDWLNADVVDVPYLPRKGASQPMDIFSTAFFANSTEILSRMAKVLGRDAESRKYAELAAQIRAAFCREFLKPDGRIMGQGEPEPALSTGAGVPVNGDNQTTYALALHFGLIPGNMRETAARLMVERIKDYNGRLSTGIHGTYRLLLELSDAGYTDLAYKLLDNRDVPSWRYMLDHGATTIWERWDGFVEGRGFQTPYMNSFNHCAFGAVAEWIWRVAGGLNPDPESPGYKHFLVRPRPGGGLTWAKATYDSIRGRIISHWSIEGGRFTLRVTVPPNTTATVVMPKGEKHEIGSGEYTFSER